MNEREKLEDELSALDNLMKSLQKELVVYKERRHQVWMKLNRARRLEREELQNAERNS